MGMVKSEVKFVSVPSSMFAGEAVVCSDIVRC